ncbi:hypothetical protein F2P81_016671 [Scophthalmus maximus]|uniref:LysM and peptidoglycan-binding domain-containing protein 1 n=2 Tax=Scophthalmus maximus TaxID=52904 RepID=A0A6A4SA95_SCOMX|nr:hypothetical protein F2P81_016671 [Scophthalmus maximus]
MSAGPAPPPADDDGDGLLRGSRARSYGSLVRSPLSPVRQRRVEHQLEAGETLPGLALSQIKPNEYKTSLFRSETSLPKADDVNLLQMEQIKRANRLYTNDSIFLKKSLSIPVLSDMDGCANGGDVTGEDCGGDNAGCAPAHNRSTRSASANELGDVRQRAADLTPVDFLKRLDELINQSKQAAVRGCQDAEKRVAALEAACTRGASGWRPLPRSSTGQQQREAAHRAVPLTITKLTMNVRDREDDIFEL